MREPLLQVYVSAGCLGCVLAEELDAHLRRARPDAAVQTIDLDRSAGHPADLVGTPTYRLGGRIRWLGNPSAEDLVGAWDEGVRADRREASDGM